MLPLRPRVGKVNVQRCRRSRRQKVFEEIGGLNAKAAQVHQTGGTPLAVQLPDAAEQSLNADEVTPGVAPGIFHQERAVTAAQLHFERLDYGKELCHINPIDD